MVLDTLHNTRINTPGKMLEDFPRASVAFSELLKTKF